MDRGGSAWNVKYTGRNESRKRSKKIVNVKTI